MDMEPVLAIDFNIKDILPVTFIKIIFFVDLYFRYHPRRVHCYAFSTGKFS